MKRFPLFLAVLIVSCGTFWLWQHRNVFPEGQRGKFPELFFGDQGGRLEVRMPMDVRNGVRHKKIEGRGSVLSYDFDVRITDANDDGFTLLWVGNYKIDGRGENSLNREMKIPYNRDAVTLAVGDALVVGARVNQYDH